MSKLLRSPVWFMVLILTTITTFAAPSPIVRAVIFFAPHSSQCDELYAYLLPSLITRYGNRLELVQVDVTQPEGAKLYQTAGARYGLDTWIGIPTVLIGNQSLIGLDTIAATLGDNFESLVTEASPATHWPDLPGLAALIPEKMLAITARMATFAPIQNASYVDNWHSRFLQDPIGNSLALGVLFFMVTVLIHTLIRLRSGTRNPQSANTWLSLILVIGMGISAYTAYASFAGVAPMCGPIGDCVTVQASVYSRILGIPLGIFGIMAYGTLLISWPLARRFSPQGGGWRWLPWTIALVGFAFSLRLTILEPFVIGATCLWCLGSALAMTAALWLLTGTIL